MATTARHAHGGMDTATRKRHHHDHHQQQQHHQHHHHHDVDEGAGGCCGGDQGVAEEGGPISINQRTGQPIRVACLPCHRARTLCDRDARALEAGDGSRPPCSRCVRLGREGSCVDRPPRKTTKVACTHCIRAKRSCGEQRPCKRCVSRGLADQCTDREAPSSNSSASSAPSPASPGRARAAAASSGATPVTSAAAAAATAAVAAAAAAAAAAAHRQRQRQPRVVRPTAVMIPASSAFYAPQAVAAPVAAAAAKAAAASDELPEHRPKRLRLLSFEGPAQPYGTLDLSTTPMLSFPVLMQSPSIGLGGLAAPMSLPQPPPAAPKLDEATLAAMPLFSAQPSSMDEEPVVRLPAANPAMMRLDSGERAMISAADSIDNSRSSINEDLDGWVAMFGGEGGAATSSRSAAKKPPAPMSPSTHTSTDGYASTLSPASPGPSFSY